MKSFLRNSFVFAVFVCFHAISIIHADAPTSTGNIFGSGVAQVCPVWNFQIEGENELKAGASQEYAISGLPEDYKASIVFSLKRDKKLIETVKNKERYLRLFASPWEASIEAKISLWAGCSYALEKKVHIYKTLIVYIGNDMSWLDDWVTELLAKRQVLLKKVELSEKSGLLESASISDALYKELSSIRDADTIIIKVADPIPVLTALEKVRKNSSTQFSFEKKGVYIVSDVRKNLLGKLLASSLKLLWIHEAGILRSDNTLDFLLQISSGTEHKIKWIDSISYQEGPGIFSLGSLVEYISYEWFPISFLGLLLGISVAILVLNFLKQIVGMYTFGIYNPILLAISLSIMNARLAGAFLLLAFLSVNITNFFAKKFYLLYQAKRSLLISLYILLSIIFLGIAHLLWFSSPIDGAFSNPFVIFPLFFMIVIADKVFHEDINIMSKNGVWLFLQFILVSLLSYWIINSIGIRYFLLSYPDLLILIAGGNLAIGRYTGLQVFEYARFLPLIGKLREQEE